MGCDIHSMAELKKDGKWMPILSDGRTVSWGSFFERNSQFLEPFGNRDYSVFAFLADVRNYDHCTPIIPETRGLPKDSEWLNSPHKYAYDVNPMSGEAIPVADQETNMQYVGDYGDYHSHSWITLKELLDHDYDKTFWNRRITRQLSPNCWSGSEIANEGEGKIISYRENLGEEFFKDIELLKTYGNPEDVRVIFWFDN